MPEIDESGDDDAVVITCIQELDEFVARRLRRYIDAVAVAAGSYLAGLLICLGGRYWDRTSGPCRVKRGVGGLRIKHMRGRFPFATGTWYHVMSFDITQYRDRTVPELSQLRRAARQGQQLFRFARAPRRLTIAASRRPEQLHVRSDAMQDYRTPTDPIDEKKVRSQVEFREATAG